MQPVLGLVEHDGMRAVHDLVGQDFAVARSGAKSRQLRPAGRDSQLWSAAGPGVIVSSTFSLDGYEGGIRLGS